MTNEPGGGIDSGDAGQDASPLDGVLPPLDRHRILLAVAKLVIVPVVLGVVIAQAFRYAPQLPVSFDLVWLLIAALIYFVGVMAQSGRLCTLVASFGSHLDLWTAQVINLRAHLYFFVLPSGMAMEAVRFFDIRKSGAGLSATDTTAVLVLDRLAGAFASAALLAVAALSVTPRLQLQWNGWYVAAAVLLVAVAGVIAAATVRRIQVYLRRILGLLGRNWPIVARGFFYGVVSNLLTVAGAWLAARGMKIPVGFDQTLWAAMAGQILMLIPVTFMGVGAAEIGGAPLLIATGVAPLEAVTVVFIIYLMRASAALQGLTIELWHNGRLLLRRH